MAYLQKSHGKTFWKTRSSPMEKGVYVTYEGIPEMWKNSQLPVIDKPHINGGFPFKETVCSDSRQGICNKKGEKTYQVLEFLLPIFLRRNKDMEL